MLLSRRIGVRQLGPDDCRNLGHSKLSRMAKNMMCSARPLSRTHMHLQFGGSRNCERGSCVKLRRQRQVVFGMRLQSFDTYRFCNLSFTHYSPTLLPGLTEVMANTKTPLPGSSLPRRVAASSKLHMTRRTTKGSMPMPSQAAACLITCSHRPDASRDRQNRHRSILHSSGPAASGFGKSPSEIPSQTSRRKWES